MARFVEMWPKEAIYCPSFYCNVTHPCSYDYSSSQGRAEITVFHSIFLQ